MTTLFQSGVVHDFRVFFTSHFFSIFQSRSCFSNLRPLFWIWCGQWLGLFDKLFMFKFSLKFDFLSSIFFVLVWFDEIVSIPFNFSHFSLPWFSTSFQNLFGMQFAYNLLKNFLNSLYDYFPVDNWKALFSWIGKSSLAKDGIGGFQFEKFLKFLFIEFRVLIFLIAYHF